MMNRLIYIFGFLMLYCHSSTGKSDNDITVELLRYAASGDLNSVKKVIESGLPIDSADSVFGATALHNASSQGHAQVVQWLLDNGASVGQKDKQGQTALLWAAYHGRSEIISQLLKAGMSLNDEPEQASAVLVAAIQSGDLVSVSLLLKAGAQMNVTTESALTAEQAAKMSNNQGIIDLLNQYRSVDDE